MHRARALGLAIRAPRQSPGLRPVTEHDLRATSWTRSCTWTAPESAGDTSRTTSRTGTRSTAASPNSSRKACSPSSTVCVAAASGERPLRARAPTTPAVTAAREAAASMYTDARVSPHRDATPRRKSETGYALSLAGQLASASRCDSREHPHPAPGGHSTRRRSPSSGGTLWLPGPWAAPPTQPGSHSARSEHRSEGSPPASPQTAPENICFPPYRGLRSMHRTIRAASKICCASSRTSPTLRHRSVTPAKSCT